MYFLNKILLKINFLIIWIYIFTFFLDMEIYLLEVWIKEVEDELADIGEVFDDADHKELFYFRYHNTYEGKNLIRIIKKY